MNGYFLLYEVYTNIFKRALYLHYEIENVNQSNKCLSLTDDLIFKVWIVLTEISPLYKHLCSCILN